MRIIPVVFEIDSADNPINATFLLLKKILTELRCANSTDTYFLQQFSSKGDINMKMWKLAAMVLVFGAGVSALKMCSNYPHTTENLVGLKLKEHQESTEDFDKSIQIRHNSTNPNLNKGFIKFQSGDYQGAIEDFTQAIEKNPNDAEAYSNRGAVQMGLKKYQQAIEDYNKALEINPELAEVHVNRGLVRAKLGNYKAAIADYNQSIQINPEYDNAYFNRGVAYHKLGDDNNAQADSQKLADLYKKQGAAVDSEEILNTIKQFDSNPRNK